MIVPAVLIFVAICFHPLGTNARSYDYDKREVINFETRRIARQIVPGTKWCGNGDSATGDEDLGRIKETDKCCRQHDKCPMFIVGHETNYGLTNPDSSTRSHCECDDIFFNCLTNTTSGLSSTVGGIYFNLLRKKCFREKTCPDGKKCKNVEYEWVDSKTWLPTDVELDRLHDNTALINPELEFD